MAPVTRSSVEQIPLSYASCSKGCKSSHTLPQKLESISKAGFIAIELCFPDILEYGAHILGHTIAPDNYAELREVGAEIRKLCDANSLTVMMLQPFANFEGWPKGSPEREDAFARAKGWMEIMKVVGTDLLQVCSSPKCFKSEDPSINLISGAGWIDRFTRREDQHRSRNNRR